MIGSIMPHVFVPLGQTSRKRGHTATETPRAQGKRRIKTSVLSVSPWLKFLLNVFVPGKDQMRRRRRYGIILRMTDVYRYCPQCAQPLQDRPAFGRVRRVCPACGFIHFRDLKVGAATLVERGDEILLLLRPPDDVFDPATWGLPAGFVEHDESPRQAAAREAREETGLRVKVGELFGVYFYTDDPRSNGVLIVYRATATGGALRPQRDEAAALRWFRFAALPENISGGGIGPAIRQWVETKRLRAVFPEAPAG